MRRTKVFRLSRAAWRRGLQWIAESAWLRYDRATVQDSQVDGGVGRYRY